MVSLAQAAFFGIAGYALGLIGYERGIPFPLADLLAIGVVLVFAAVFGLIANRAKGIVFLMITLAFGQVVFAFALQNTTFLHGWAGIRGIRPPILFGIDFKQTANFYWAALSIYIVALFVLWRIVKSPFGLILNGIRESSERMDALGYPTYWIRVVAFLIAAVYAGIGGLIASLQHRCDHANDHATAADDLDPLNGHSGWRQLFLGAGRLAQSWLSGWMCSSARSQNATTL